MATTIYHNPKCSKSRQTLALLEENGEQPDIIEYLQTPPTAEELKSILSMLGVAPAALIRKKEAAEAGVIIADSSEAALIDAMVANPQIIERPVVVKNGLARIGRPPESVLEIL